MGATILAASPNYRWDRDNRDTPYGSDFLQDWTGANMIVAGSAGSLFDAATFDAWQHDPERTGFRWNPNAYYPTVYPPPHYLLVSPLGWMSYRWAVPVWLGILLGCLLATAAVTEKIIASKTAARGTEWFWPGMLFFPPLLLSLTMGQKGAVWLLIWAVAWSLYYGKRPMAAGMVFGLLSIKPTLFFLLPLVMLYHRQWRFVSGAALSCGGIWLFAACILPYNVWSEFLEVAREVGNYHQHTGYRLHWSCNLLSLVSGMEAPWLPGWVGCTLLAIVAGYVIYRLAALQPLALDEDSEGFDVDHGRYFGCVLLATCLLSPHFYIYDVVVCLLPIRILWSGSRYQALLLLALIWGGMLASQQCANTIGLPLMPVVLMGAFYLLSTVTPGQSSVRKGVSGRFAPSNMLHTGLSPQA